MSNPEARFQSLAESISDGKTIDWAAAEDAAGRREDRVLLHNLKIVSDIGRCLHATGSATTEFRPDEPAPPPSFKSAERPASTPPMSAGPETHPDWGPLTRLSRIGQGAFGEVYQAWEARLQRWVALKLFPFSNDEFVESALNEGRLLAQVKHPNVVTVFGIEHHDGRTGIWMEFIQGKTLADLLREQGRFGAAEAAAVGATVCQALAAVHRAGVLHRDVKAQNVMREDGGRVVLMDFGVGRSRDFVGSTQNRQVIGTPIYLAPEVLQGGSPSVSADIYSVGVLLYHLVTSEFPEVAKSLAELISARSQGRVRLLRDLRSDLPGGYYRIVERALSPDPASRFATPGEMAQALEGFVAPRSAERSPPESELPTPPAQMEVSSTHRQSWTRRLWLAVPLAAALMSGYLVLGKVSAYDVRASLYVERDGRSEKLDPDDSVRPGDLVYADFNGSRPLYVYVINRDDRGESYLLFPLPNSSVSNPVPSGRVTLPGRVNGVGTGWQITSVGGHEHFVILASPHRLAEFEAQLSALEPASQGRPVKLNDQTLAKVRGAGGLKALPDQASGTSGSPAQATQTVFDLARRLAGEEKGVRGVWVRQIDLRSEGVKR